MVDILLNGRLIWVLSNLYFDRLFTRSLTLWTYRRHQSVEAPGSQKLRLGKRDQHEDPYRKCQKADLWPITAKGRIGIEVSWGWIAV